MRFAAVLLAVAVCPAWAVVGDSVTYDSADELQAHGAVVSAFGGVTINQGRPALQQFAADGQDAVVVALGIMDVAQWATPQQLQSRVQAALADLNGVPCVIWVDLRPQSTLHTDWPERTARFNRIIERDAPNVARWSTASAGHPQWFRSDRFHPNRRGQAAYAAFIARSVDRYCN